MRNTAPLRIAALASLALLAGCASGQPAFSRMSADSLLQYGLGKLEARDWNDAVQALQQFTFQFPAHERYQEARFRLADAYFGKKEFITAIAEYSRLAGDYPQGEYSDDARFRACESYTRLSPRVQLDQQYTQSALDHCESLIAYFPDSPFTPRARELADDMRNKLAEKLFLAGDFYLKLGAYDSAVKYFDDTLKAYPNAKVAPRVLFRMFEAYQRMGYADEAKDVRERLIRDFPTSEEAKRIQAISVAGRM
jgi:outer membrane protein assembly factor BamD